MNAPRRANSERLGLRPVAARAVMVSLLLLCAALVWHDLGAREVLGRDENITVVNLDHASLGGMLYATQVRLNGDPSNTQPLYFLLQYPFWELVGRSAFMLRFLPSLFALLSVLFTYKLGHALLSQEAGLLAALLTALLPLQIRYAQIARPYTMLACLSLASAYFLVRGLQTNRTVHWAGFVATATAAFYTHFNALFVMVAEGLFAGIIWLSSLGSVLKKRQDARRLVSPVLAFLLVGALCLPGLLRLVGMPWVGPAGESNPDLQVVAELSLPFFSRLVNEIGLTTPWLRALLLALAVLGLAMILYRRRWQAALFCVLWLVVPFLVLSVMKSPRPFEERYVIFVPPVAFLLTGQGILVLGKWLGALGQRWSQRSAQWVAVAAICLLVALLFITPLYTHYEANRAADRLDQSLMVLERNATPGDLVIVSRRVFVRPLAIEGAEVLYLTEHLSPAELDSLAQNYQKIWILLTTSLPPIELQEALDRWVQAQGEQFMVFPIKAPTALAFGNPATSDPEANLKERIAVLEELILSPTGDYGRWVRYNLLADAHQSLGDLYAGRGDSRQAEEHWERANQVRDEAPSPW